MEVKKQDSKIAKLFEYSDKIAFMSFQAQKNLKEKNIIIESENNNIIPVTSGNDNAEIVHRHQCKHSNKIAQAWQYQKKI